MRYGLTAYVSDEDAELAERPWHACGGGYAAHQLTQPRRKIFLHRVVAERMGLKIDGLDVDHIDGDRMNNRRDNLRAATKAQNKHNQRRKKAAATSRYKGVSWCKSRRKWRATIVIDRKQRWLGDFESEEHARDSYAAAARQAFGAYAAPYVEKE
jgi:hypothetical protein